MKNHKHRKRRFRRHSRLSALPGTIVPPPDSSPPIVRLIQYGPGQHRDIEVDDVANLTSTMQELPVTWVDVCGLRDANVIKTIGGLFHLHPLALEDAVNLHQRPKVEMYGESLFFVARTMPDQEGVAHGDPFDSHQVAFFLGRDVVVTFREPETKCVDSVRKRLKAAKGRIRESGADYLLYALIDVTVDSYFPVLEDRPARLFPQKRLAVILVSRSRFNGPVFVSSSPRRKTHRDAN